MPITPPTPTLYTNPVGVGINPLWLAHILGILEIGTKEYHWLPDEYHATNQIEEFMRFLTIERLPPMIIGQVIQGSFQTPPSYLLPCDGSVHYASEFPELFAVIEDAYKLGNGIQFTTPDFIGRFPVGVGQRQSPSNQINYTKGQAGGSQDVILNLSQMPRHRHAPTSGVFIITTTSSNGTSSASMVAGLGGASHTAYEGNDQPHTNIPPYLAINFYIVARMP